MGRGWEAGARGQGLEIAAQRMLESAEFFGSITGYIFNMLFNDTEMHSDLRNPSWQSHLINLLVRARMRPHVYKPIDPVWVRANMGRPRNARELIARSTGAVMRLHEPQHGWPGGEIVSAREPSVNSPVLLYLHGGGYIACSPETHRILVGILAQRLQSIAYVPRYRLAPEHPFPAGLNDAISAYRHIVEHERIPPERVFLVGDSAGGGLALALGIAIRDQHLPRPAGIVTFSPWADLTGTSDSLEENSDRCAMFAGVTIRRAAQLYVGNADPYHPWVSPGHADFTGLPPVLVHASSDEVLRDDAIRVAEQARRAGVPVTFRLWRRVPHAWQFFARVLPEARQSLAEVDEFVRRHMSQQSAPTV